MDRTTVRGIAFWTAVAGTLMELMLRAVYLLIPFANTVADLSSLYQVLSVVGFLITILSTGSLLLFLGLVHYDLMTAQRLSEHARDYLIRDLTQSPQENRPNHG